MMMFIITPYLSHFIPVRHNLVKEVCGDMSHRHTYATEIITKENCTAASISGTCWKLCLSKQIKSFMKEFKT